MKELKKIIILVIIVLMTSIMGCHQNANEESLDISSKGQTEVIFTADSIKATIKSLPTVRELGTDKEKQACTFLVKKLLDYNYNVETQVIEYSLADGGFAIESSEPFPVNLEKIAEGETNNIVAKHKQYDSSKKDIIIAAHYDTTSFPGANDNASGVAVLIEIAKNIKHLKDYNLVFVLFSGEEKMLLGSHYFVNNLSDEEKKNIAAVMNLDTLSGESEPEITFASHKYTEAYYMFENIFKNKLEVNLLPAYSSGDEIPFNNAEIPSLSIGQEGENLHTDQDILENLDMNDLVTVYNVLSTALKTME